MKDIDFINTFFNIIYQNESAYMRDLMSSYEYTKQFCQWLRNRSIPCFLLDQLTEEDFQLFSKRTKAEDIDHILHIPFSTMLKELSMQYHDATHILYLPGFLEDSCLDINEKQYKDIYIYSKKAFQRKDLSFFDPFPAFFCAESCGFMARSAIFNQDNQFLHLFIINRIGKLY